MNHAFWMAITALHLGALVDVCTSRLSRSAKLLWIITLAFLPAVGLLAWLLTRHSAHRALEAIQTAQE